MSVVLKFGIILGSFGLFMHWLSFSAFNMHNSNLNYKHMLQCTKVCWKITCVSLGEFIGPMQEMGMRLKHLGFVARSGTLRNLVFKFLEIQNSPENHETWHGVISWHQHVVVKKLVAFGQVFGISFLQTGASLEKTHGSWGGTCHLCVRNDIPCLPPFIFL